MDPSKTLDELEELFAQPTWDIGDIERLIVLWGALDRWMSTGGFLPKKWER